MRDPRVVCELNYIHAQKTNEITIAYGFSLNDPQSRASENTELERTLPGFLAAGLVNSPRRITLENNGKIRPQPDRENAFARASGGEGVRKEAECSAA